MSRKFPRVIQHFPFHFKEDSILRDWHHALRIFNGKRSLLFDFIHLGTKQFLNMLSTFFGKILSHFSARTAELAEGDENNLSQKIQRRLVQIERVEDAASFARCAKFLFNYTSVDSLRLSFYFAPIQLILLSCSSP